MKNVAGVFDSKKEVDAAVLTLLDTGLSKEHMSLIVSDNARHAIQRWKRRSKHKTTSKY